MLVLVSWILCSAPGHAGQLVVESRDPVEVFVDQLPVLRLYGPGSATVAVPAGEHTLGVYRGARPEVLVAEFPAKGNVTLLVGPSTLSLVDAVVAPAAGQDGAPLLELRVPPGPGAVVILAGERLTLVAGQPLTVTGLEAGTTSLEVRSVDGSMTWARGELALIAGDRLVMVLPEGRPLEVFGRAKAWVPGS